MNCANPFYEISDIARTIAQMGPDVHDKLATLRSNLNYCRNQESLQAEVAPIRQEIVAWEKCQKDVNGMMRKLVRLSGKHLSDVKLHLLTQLPFDRKWDEIVPELNRIQDISLSKAVRGETANQNVKIDTQTESDKIITTAQACKIIDRSEDTLRKRAKVLGIKPVRRGYWNQSDVERLK